MYTQEDVRKVQCRLLEMAKIVRDVLEKHSIPYFITYGTLLGAVRHKGFIPWDDDFDFYLFDDSYNDAMKVLSSELPENLFLEYWETEPKYFHAWAHVKDQNTIAECKQFPQDGQYAHKGISVDLYKMKMMRNDEVDSYRLDESIDYFQRRFNRGLIDEDLFKEKITSLLRKKQSVRAKEPDSKIVYATVLPILDRMEINDVFPLRKYTFEDTFFYGPNHADVFLSQRYGDYMALPPVSDRKPHYSSVVFL